MSTTRLSFGATNIFIILYDSSVLHYTIIYIVDITFATSLDEPKQKLHLVASDFINWCSKTLFNLKFSYYSVFCKEYFVVVILHF